MATTAETTAGVELDSRHDRAPIVLGPDEAHRKPTAELDRAGVSVPGVEPLAAVGTSNGRVTGSPKAGDGVRRGLLVVDGGKEQPSGGARRHYLLVDPGRGDVAEALTGCWEPFFGGRQHEDQAAILPPPSV